MRATTKNLVVAEANNLPLIDWMNTPRFDAPAEMPITLKITRQHLGLARSKTNACAIAQACDSRNFAFFSIGVDVAYIGAFMDGKPVRLRYRSGYLPKRFDAAVKNMYKTGVFDVRHLETDSYVLRPASESQSLENKKIDSKNRAKDLMVNPAKKATIKKRPNNKNRDLQEWEGRGRLYIR